jgi:hypothetical protein
MKPKEFFDLVSEMRQAQRQYFKFGTRTELNKAIRLEKQVDTEIERVNQLLNPMPDNKQMEIDF